MSYEEVQSLAQKIIESESTKIYDLDILDIENFCPRYGVLNQSERTQFFSHLMAVMSQLESCNKTETIFVENNGNKSTGLMQISFRSISEKYKQNGCTDVNSTEDLKDPDKNLKCGLAIMTSLVRDYGAIAKTAHQGASAYWSTLRKPYKVYIKSIDKTVRLGKQDEVIKLLKEKISICFE